MRSKKSQKACKTLSWCTACMFPQICWWWHWGVRREILRGLARECIDWFSLWIVFLCSYCKRVLSLWLRFWFLKGFVAAAARNSKQAAARRTLSLCTDFVWDVSRSTSSSLICTDSSNTHMEIILFVEDMAAVRKATFLSCAPLVGFRTVPSAEGMWTCKPTNKRQRLSHILHVISWGLEIIRTK